MSRNALSDSPPTPTPRKAPALPETCTHCWVRRFLGSVGCPKKLKEKEAKQLDELSRLEYRLAAWRCTCLGACLGGTGIIIALFFIFVSVFGVSPWGGDLYLSQHILPLTLTGLIFLSLYALFSLLGKYYLGRAYGQKGLSRLVPCWIRDRLCTNVRRKKAKRPRSSS